MIELLTYVRFYSGITINELREINRFIS